MAKVKHHLIALTCLILAAKYDELDCNIPMLQDFQKIANSKLVMVRIDAIKECETAILRLIDWNLKIITPIVFVEMLLTQGVVFSNDKINNGENAGTKAAKNVKKHAMFLSDFCLQCKI